MGFFMDLTKPYNYANEAAISAPTAKQWLSVLVSSGMVDLMLRIKQLVLRT